MQSRGSSSFVVITFLFLLFAGGPVVARISAPICTDIVGSSWKWSFNSLDQNPCTVTAYLMATCYGGVFAVDPLFVGGAYLGPSKKSGTHTHAGATP
ncbi:hypothetical protein H4582DRAFT_311114 [Lactarius indigo]|nr:hypothetical protein H4582DRAFT_311114 [Lactarius indigo]